MTPALHLRMIGRPAAPPSRAVVDALLGRCDRAIRLQRIVERAERRYWNARIEETYRGSLEKTTLRLQRYMRLWDASLRATHATRGELEDALLALLEVRQ